MATTRLTPFRYENLVSKSGYEIVNKPGDMVLGRPPFSRGLDCEDLVDAMLPPIGDMPEIQTEWDCNDGMLLAPADNSRDFTSYDPMAVRNLHRIFAGMPDDTNSIIEFANKYGMLGLPIGVLNTELGEPIAVESVSFWRSQRFYLQTAIDYLDVSKSETESREYLVSILREILGEYAVCYQESGATTAAEWLEGALSSKAAADYVLSFATRTAVGPTVTDSLRYAELAKLLLEARINLALELFVTPTVSVGTHTVLLSPAHTLGALYALLAEESIGSDYPMKICPGCNRWFQPLDPRKSTCSDKCRQRTYRNRNKRGLNV